MSTTPQITAADINELALDYANMKKVDEAAADKLRDELWSSSYSYMCWLHRRNYAEKDHYDPRNAWDVTDAIGAAATHLPSWIELYNPAKGSWSNYLQTQFKAMRRRETRPGNFGHRVHEACIRVLERVRNGADETTALRLEMDEASPEQKPLIRECFEQIRVRSVSLSTPLSTDTDDAGSTVGDLIADETGEEVFAAVVDRTSRTPVLRKLHDKHTALIEQLSEGVNFPHLQFGEALSLPSKAIRLSEALSRAKQAYDECENEEMRLSKLRLTPIPSVRSIVSVPGKDTSNAHTSHRRTDN